MGEACRVGVGWVPRGATARRFGPCGRPGARADALGRKGFDLRPDSPDPMRPSGLSSPLESSPGSGALSSGSSMIARVGIGWLFTRREPGEIPGAAGDRDEDRGPAGSRPRRPSRRSEATPSAKAHQSSGIGTRKAKTGGDADRRAAARVVTFSPTSSGELSFTDQVRGALQKPRRPFP